MWTEYSAPWLTVYLPSQRAGYLGDAPTVNGIRCHGDVLSFRGNTLILSLTVRYTGNVLSFRCPGDGLQYSRFQAWFTSRCVVMDVFVSGVLGKRVAEENVNPLCERNFSTPPNGS
jgi:hypothetical protein